MVVFFEELTRASQVTLVVKNLSANAENARDRGLIPGSRRSPREGNGSPLNSCLVNPMQRGGVCEVTESDTTEHHSTYFEV